jgi:hypothetical protein
MLKTVSFELSPALPHEDSPAFQNPAVAHCCEIWESTRLKALKDGRSLVLARVAAHKAYQKALPPLAGDENIRNFIACVAQGMLQGSILSPDGARLLYAAQVAKSAARASAAQSKATAE